MNDFIDGGQHLSLPSPYDELGERVVPSPPPSKYPRFFPISVFRTNEFRRTFGNLNFELQRGQDVGHEIEDSLIRDELVRLYSSYNFTTNSF